MGFPSGWERAGGVSGKRSCGNRNLAEPRPSFEARCRQFYHKKLGRASLAPGMYFRVMLIGFFKGIERERGIAWRVADSLCLLQFLQIGLGERTRICDHLPHPLDEAAPQEVFGWVLRQVARAGLLKPRQSALTPPRWKPIPR